MNGEKRSSVPFITPLEIPDEPQGKQRNVALFERLLEEINKAVEDTCVSLQGGTVTAIPLDKEVNDRDMIDILLKGQPPANDRKEKELGLSPIDFVFLRRLKKINLLSLRANEPPALRVFCFEHALGSDHQQGGLRVCPLLPSVLDKGNARFIVASYPLVLTPPYLMFGRLRGVAATVGVCNRAPVNPSQMITLLA